MKPKHSEAVQRILVLLQLDAQALMDRIIHREKEYLHRFNLSRTRFHFKEIFDNRYAKMSIDVLKDLSEEVIVSADNFYNKAETLYWYFMQTEDMGVAAEDHCSKTIFDIQGSYDIFSSFLRAEITGQEG
ncbi:MAG: hypothetical protein E2O68_05165 [Deltaproteobacteria bacterium]|nr:MAG: hypothetical protein E2O68_05165 [Deltaproteobacteria bacterium]